MSPRGRPITGTKWKQQHIPGRRSAALLLRDGSLTVEQLEQALHDKESSGKRLGEILVDRGYVTPTQISRVLAEQHELPFVDLARETDRHGGRRRSSPSTLARRYNAIPVRFLADGAVLVAVNDPTNVMASDDLRIALGATVRVGVASRDAIENAITRIYASELDFDEGAETPEDELTRPSSTSARRPRARPRSSR